MQYLRGTFLIVLIGILMNPIMLFAAPHEPSPAGGDWLELNPKLGLTQTEAPWLPELTGKLTIEAWIYVDETLPKQITFSFIGQTDRFGCLMVGVSVDENRDNIMDTRIGVFSNGTKRPFTCDEDGKPTDPSVGALCGDNRPRCRHRQRRSYFRRP